MLLRSAAMLEIFRELRGLLHVSHVYIDSYVFRLHYSVTTTCMFAFSFIVSAKQYVGNPIDCIHTKDIPEVSFLLLQWMPPSRACIALCFLILSFSSFLNFVTVTGHVLLDKTGRKLLSCCPSGKVVRPVSLKMLLFCIVLFKI